MKKMVKKVFFSFSLSTLVGKNSAYILFSLA